MMDHPLLNPSLTPIGFGAGITPQRTSWRVNDWMLNGDYLAADFWQRRNCLKADNRPITSIIHGVMRSLKTLGGTTVGDIMFDGLPYRIDDLAILTSMAVWLGTNVGRAFCEDVPPRMPKYHPSQEFRLKLTRDEERYGHTMADFFLHVHHKCFSRLSTHCLIRKQATKRQLLAIDAFAFWLGTSEGREYLARLKRFMTKERTRHESALQERRNKERQKICA
jgi:hypothetical protein